MPISSLDMAYLAGIVDGEGSITIARTKNKLLYDKRRKKFYKKSPQHILIVCVSMCYEPIIRMFEEAFGGSVFMCKGTNKPIWKWQLNANKAKNCLLQLLPHLKLKRKNADIGIAFQNNRINQSRTFKRDEKGKVLAGGILPNELEIRDLEIKALSHIGEYNVAA